MHSKPPVIFLAFANDKQTADGYLRNLTRERTALRTALDIAINRDRPICEVVVESDLTIDRLFDIFQNDRYRDRIAVFHYGGHSESYKLLLEDAQGGRSAADSAGLVPFLSSQKSLQLVFLNGCSTQWQAKELRDAGVPAVIGTSRAIPDDVANVISGRFYHGLHMVCPSTVSGTMPSFA